MATNRSSSPSWSASRKLTPQESSPAAPERSAELSANEPRGVREIQDVPPRFVLQGRAAAVEVGNVEVPGAVAVDVGDVDAHAGLRVVADPGPIAEHLRVRAVRVAEDLVDVARTVGVVAGHVDHVQVGPQVGVEVGPEHQQRPPIGGDSLIQAGGRGGVGEGAVAGVAVQAVAGSRRPGGVDHQVGDVQIDTPVAVVIQPRCRLGAVAGQRPVGGGGQPAGHPERPRAQRVGGDSLPAQRARQSPEGDRPAGRGGEQQQRDQGELEQQRHVDQHADRGGYGDARQAVAQEGIHGLRLQDLDGGTARKPGHHHDRPHAHDHPAGRARPAAQPLGQFHRPAAVRLRRGRRRQVTGFRFRGVAGHARHQRAEQERGGQSQQHAAGAPTAAKTRRRSSSATAR